MDSLFAIGLGLGIRLLVDVVSHQDFRLGGTLVGLWEGVVLYHFLNKMPHSYDPYVAYGIRLFVDFLFTESLYRMAVVILWTGLGTIMADVGPVIWYDSGLQHLFRRFRRDLALVGIPTLPFFSKSTIGSRVRFHETPSPTIASSSRSTSTATITPPSPRVPLKSRPVPGSFPGDWSETDTESVRYLPPPSRSDASDDASTIHDIPHGVSGISENLSETTDDDSDLGDADQITENPDDEILSESSADLIEPSAARDADKEDASPPAAAQDSDRDRTPTIATMPLPPTPDSIREDFDTHEVQHLPSSKQPSLVDIPNIPDAPETHTLVGEHDEHTVPTHFP